MSMSHRRNARRRKNLKWITISVLVLLLVGLGIYIWNNHLFKAAHDLPAATQAIASMTLEASPLEPTDVPVDSQEPIQTDEVDLPQVTSAPRATIAPTSVPTVEPTAEPPLKGLKIGIDPGHQKKGNKEKEPVAPGSKKKKAKVSSGTQGISTRVAEYVVNLDVANLLKAELEAQGAEVLMSRESHDVDISNIERAQMMNEWGADLVLRIHCNGSENKNTQGIGLYVRKTGAKSEQSYAAAAALLPAMLEVTGAKESGIFSNDTYTGLNWSEVPCILVEMGYMSNPEEDERLNDPKYQQLLVKGMVQGIADYFEREYIEE